MESEDCAWWSVRANRSYAFQNWTELLATWSQITVWRFLKFFVLVTLGFELTGLTPASQVLYHLSHISSPGAFENKFPMRNQISSDFKIWKLQGSYLILTKSLWSCMHLKSSIS
jgi:hypothetical protein